MMTDDTSPSPRRKLPFRAWLWEKPAAAESGGRRRLRIFCRIVAIFLREFERDAIPLRASALTFTIILSMVPMLALSTAVLKGFGAGGQMRKAAHNLINTMEPRQPAAATVPGVVSPGQPPVVTPTENGPPPRPATLTIHLKTAVDTVFNSVERTNLTTLGMFGLAALFITVISVLSTIEDAMNVVWQAESGRALGRKIMDFLALMLLLPLAVNIGVAAMAALKSEAALAILEHIFPVVWAGPLLVRLLSSSFLVMTLVLLYRFLPNTRVPLFPALIGALVGGTGWLAIQSLYINLQIGVARYNAIYGSFATLPLFFLWIFVGWMVFLAGAELAFAVHVRHRYQPKYGKKILPPRMELALAYDLLTVLFDDFRARRTSDLDSLTRRLDYSDFAITEVLRKLMAAGLVRLADGGDTDNYLPATPADRLPTAEVLDVILGPVSPETPGGLVAGQAINGAHAALAGRAMDKLETGS